MSVRVPRDTSVLDRQHDRGLTPAPDSHMEHTLSTETEKLQGSAKEAIGDAVGDEDLQTEGEQQQKKARKAEEAEELQEKAEQKAQQAAGHAGAEKSAS